MLLKKVGLTAALMVTGVLAAAATKAASSVDTLNKTKSKALSSVSEEFSRLEFEAGESIALQQIAYRQHADHTTEEALEKLLVDISGGPEEIKTPKVNAVSNSVDEARRFIPDEKLASEIANSSSQGVKVYSSVVVESSGASRVLILADSSTKELLVLYSNN